MPTLLGFLGQRSSMQCPRGTTVDYRPRLPRIVHPLGPPPDAADRTPRRPVTSGAQDRGLTFDTLSVGPRHLRGAWWSLPHGPYSPIGHGRGDGGRDPHPDPFVTNSPNLGDGFSAPKPYVTLAFRCGSSKSVPYHSLHRKRRLRGGSNVCDRFP